AFIMWVRSTFVSGDLSSDVIAGAGGYNWPRLERSDGRAVFRADKAFEDYRAYIARNFKKPRMAHTLAGWIEEMEKAGFEPKRVVKDRLTMGGRKLPDASGA